MDTDILINLGMNEYWYIIPNLGINEYWYFNKSGDEWKIIPNLGINIILFISEKHFQFNKIVNPESVLLLI